MKVLMSGNILYMFSTILCVCSVCVIALRDDDWIGHMLQAILFWVVDNFLKRSIQQSKTMYVNCQEPRVKYFRSSDQVKCYNRIEKGEESDVLSAEEDGDPRHRNNDPSERLISAK